MARHSLLDKPWKLIIPGELFADLHDHLFPGDENAHAAVILAGLADTDRDVRVLAREFHPARDGYDYVPGKRGKHTLRAAFVTTQVLRARDSSLLYFAVHNHRGTDYVAFSDDDLRSQERGYPALLDIMGGSPVGALVFARSAIAGNIWLSDRSVVPLSSATVVDYRRQCLVAKPPRRLSRTNSLYSRQAQLFGDHGQEILNNSKVAVIGLGGVGSLFVELLSRLGVGHFVLVDPDRVERSNLPRLIGATSRDAGIEFGVGISPRLQMLGRKSATRKVKLAKRNIRRANPKATVEVFATDITSHGVANRLIDCDYLFLAADSFRARLLFNVLVHQYLIPGVQVGTKVLINSDVRHCPEHAGDDIHDVQVLVRPVTPRSGCLTCNHLINPTRLQKELSSGSDQDRWGYVDDANIPAPSVIALNALGASQAVNNFMLYMTSLAKDSEFYGYMIFSPLSRKIRWDRPRKDPSCATCSRTAASIFALGDGVDLPTKSC